MRLRHLPSILAAVVIASTSFAFADDYKIDPEHAAVVFRINHVGVSYSYGRFNDPTGTIVDDRADPSKSSFNIEIKAENIDTDNEKRDAHLKSPDFFDVKQFPTITFKSTSVKASGDNQLEVTGELTLHGVTKPVTVAVTRSGEADVSKMKMGYRTGWEAKLDLKRSDFGMTTMVGPVGDEVNLFISLEAVKQ